MIPRDPVLRFMSKLVEDYADEWCWRAALYWRWQPIESRKLLMHRIGHEVLADFPAPKWLAGWYYGRRQMATYLRGDGLSAETEPQVKQQYLDLLDAMSELLDAQPYLLGSHPTLVDIGLFGPMFRHYAQDPTPSRVMEERAPAVYAWVGRLWNARAHRLGREPILSDFSQPGWEYFLREIAQSYWPFLLRNARAWAAGQARVDHQAHGVTYRNLKVVRYRVYCLEVLQNEYRRLSEPNRKAVDELLRPYGSIELVDGLDSGLIEEHQLPLRPNRVQPSRLMRMKLALMGTPWDMPGQADGKRESMTDQDSFTPQWFEGTLPKRSYRSAFKWGAPEAYKHPNPRLYALMKETFGLGDEHFEKPQKLGLEEVTADASISLSSEQVSFFRRLLGDENVSEDVYSRLRVSYGKTMIDALRLRDHKVENLPDLVLHPRDRDDVEQIVRYCHEQEIPLYTYAAGSSVTRGTECVKAGVSIHLGTHMKRVLSLNVVNQTVTVEPGILGPDLEAALNGARERFNAPHAYTCGHFPQSFEFSSAGGWVVTRGAGQNSTYYGKAEDLVLSQEYITPVGTIKTVDVPAYSTGPNLDQIMIGSEGAYGILVAVTLKVFRYQPENTRRFSFIFPNWQSGTAAVREIMQGEFGVPSVFRLVRSGGNRRRLQALWSRGHADRHAREPAGFQKGRALSDAGNRRRRPRLHRDGQTPPSPGLQRAGRDVHHRIHHQEVGARPLCRSVHARGPTGLRHSHRYPRVRHQLGRPSESAPASAGVREESTADGLHDAHVALLSAGRESILHLHREDGSPGVPRVSPRHPRCRPGFRAQR